MRLFKLTHFCSLFKTKQNKTKQSASFPPSDIQLVHWGVSQGQKRMTDMACNSIMKMYAFVKMSTSVSILAWLRILQQLHSSLKNKCKMLKCNWQQSKGEKDRNSSPTVCHQVNCHSISWSMWLQKQTPCDTQGVCVGSSRALLSFQAQQSLWWRQVVHTSTHKAGSPVRHWWISAF